MKKRFFRDTLIFVSIIIITAILFILSDIFADDDYVSLLQFQKKEKIYNKHGWNHYGPGYFILDEKKGILHSKNGMGLFWYGKKFKDFILECDFMVDQDKANSGIFIRIPEVPVNNDYIKKSFEVQICDTGKDPTKATGALYAAKAPDKKPKTKGANNWNHYKITCKGLQITIELNGEVVNEWSMEPAGKVTEVALEGYFGFQNHDKDTTTSFKNIRIKEL